KRARETKPLLAIVVAVRKEMLADENLEPRAKPSRRRDKEQRERAGEEELDLQRASPIAAEITNDVAGAGDREKKRGGHKKRGRMEYGAARQMHLDRPSI